MTSTAAPDSPGSRHALVVATATYTDDAFTHLRAPGQDATDVIDVLADPAIGAFDVTSVLDRPEHEIRRAVGAFLTGRGVDDLILIYLSCHGVLDARGRLYFASTDTTKAQLGFTATESTWLLDRLEECRARRQVLILDCCFSGAFAHTKGGADLDLERRLVGAGRGRVVLTASRASEYSYEGTALPDASPRSVFTEALVDGLRSGEADRDGDGYISVDDAYTYAADRVRAAGAEQSPQRWFYGAEGEIILARSRRSVAVTPTPAEPVADRPAEERAPQTGPQRCVSTVRTHKMRKQRKWLSLAAFSPDGRLLATVIGDNGNVAVEVVHLSEVATGQPAREPLTGHLLSVWALAFSPDGTVLATGGLDRTVRLWNMVTGQPVGSPLNTDEAVRVLAFSPDGQTFATGSQHSTVQLWDRASGQPVGRRLTGHTGPVGTIAFSPDGSLLASGGFADPTARVWDPVTGRCVGELGGAPTKTVAFSPDGHLLAVAGWGSTVRLWNPATGRAIRELGATHTETVAFSPDGSLLATARGNSVRLWNPITGDTVGEPLVHDIEFAPRSRQSGTVVAAAFVPDRHRLVTVTDDGLIRTWER